MPRSYSQKFLLTLFERDSDDLGTRLAKLCVKNNLPMKYVAVALNVTKLTVFNWFRGAKIRPEKHATIEAFITLVEKDAIAGQLPAQSVKLAKHYIETMIGREL